MTRDYSSVTRAPRAASVTRRALTLAAVALTATSLAACNKMSPQQTDRSYAPADGVDLSVGPVQVRNLLLVAPAKDEQAQLQGMLVNEGQQPVEVTFGFPGGDTPLKTTVNPRTSVVLGDEGLSLPKVPVAPGGMTKLVVGSASTGQQAPQVPVLAPTGPYASVTGTPTPTETTTATATPTVTHTTTVTAPPATTAPKAPAATTATTKAG